MSSSITSLRLADPAPALSWCDLRPYQYQWNYILVFSRSSLRMVAPTSCLTVVEGLCSPQMPERSTRCPATQWVSAWPSVQRSPPSPARCAWTRRPPAGARASLTWTVLTSVCVVMTAVWPPVSPLPPPTRRRGTGGQAAASVHLWRTNWQSNAVTPRLTAGAEVSREYHCPIILLNTIYWSLS